MIVIFAFSLTIIKTSPITFAMIKNWIKIKNTTKK